jgi:hypothetical protein
VTYAGTGLSVALGIVVLGNVNVHPGENGGTGPGIFTGVLCALVTVGLFVGLLPRLQRTERAAIVLAGLAVVSVAVFWSGLPPVLAAAAAAALARTEGAGRASRTMTVLAGVAAVFALGVTLAGSHLL